MDDSSTGGGLEYQLDSEMCWIFIHFTIILVSGTTQRSVIESCITRSRRAPTGADQSKGGSCKEGSVMDPDLQKRGAPRVTIRITLVRSSGRAVAPGLTPLRLLRAPK